MNAPDPLRVLLVKPYQPSPPPMPLLCMPPLGILYLAASLRRSFGDRVKVDFRDLRLDREDAARAAAEFAGKYDLVGISALSYEAPAAHELAAAVRASSPETVIALGGPYARSEPARIMAAGLFDWIFHGEADLSFPKAVEARFFGQGSPGAVPGMSWRPAPGAPYVSNVGSDIPQDLDQLPLPAWDLVPFDVYARRHNMNGTLKAKRYAPLFTSRGCPYRCDYCHDIFGKKVRWRSPESVLSEIALLRETYGVEEFQIVDDIYNLDRNRMREIAEKTVARHGRRSLFFNFPNGVRGDIIDPADLPLLRDMGVYEMTVAVETASPRLQKLIHKDLDLERVRRTIEAAHTAGISTKAFFMLGFPTETREELESTVRFAVDSKLTIAYFFSVIPQEGTPLYELAKREAPRALEKICSDHYYSGASWYQLAYGLDMSRFRRNAVLRFYLRPARILRALRRIDFNQLLLGEWQVFNLAFMYRRRAGAAGGAA